MKINWRDVAEQQAEALTPVAAELEELRRQRQAQAQVIARLYQEVDELRQQVDERRGHGPLGARVAGRIGARPHGREATAARREPAAGSGPMSKGGDMRRALWMLMLMAACAEDLPVRKQEMALAAPGVYRLGLVLAGHHLPQATAIMVGVGAAQAERLGTGCAAHTIEGVTAQESTKVKPSRDGADPEVEELTLLGAWLRCGAGR